MVLITFPEPSSSSTLIPSSHSSPAYTLSFCSSKNMVPKIFTVDDEDELEEPQLDHQPLLPHPLHPQELHQPLFPHHDEPQVVPLELSHRSQTPSLSASNCSGFQYALQLSTSGQMPSLSASG